MTDSMSGIFVIFTFFGVMIFVIVMYLLTKQVIDRNVKSISMTKILGYTDGEIVSCDVNQERKSVMDLEW